MTQLRVIHAANDIYHAQNEKYWPTDETHMDVAAINSNLDLSIMENGMQYECLGDGTGNNNAIGCKTHDQPAIGTVFVGLQPGDKEKNSRRCL